MALHPIDGHTQIFAVLGHPIGHTLSPPMQNAAIAAMGLNARYVAFDVTPESLPKVLRAAQTMGIQGLNLTIPLKEIAYRTVDSLAPSAAPLGSVNTIEFLPDGTLRGHSTDGDGFLDALQEDFGMDVAGKSVCVLGPGGAGRAIAIACARAGAAAVRITGRRDEQVSQVADDARAAGCPQVQKLAAPMSEWAQLAQGADILVQCTPVGMRDGDPPVIPTEAITPNQIVAELIYRPETTPTMNAAIAAGARTANGLSMLLHQGARSLHIWTGKEVPTDTMRQALRQAAYPHTPTEA
jgi:shikimate dehydrogenase